VLRTTSGADSAPNLAVTIGTALVLASVVTMVMFVHHLARSIIADNVIDRVGADLDVNIDRLLPEHASGGSGQPLATGEPSAPIRLNTGGYVQAVDHARLVALARSGEASIELTLRAGHLVVPGTTHGCVRPASALTPELAKDIAASVLVGSERTPVQDLEYSIRELVEVALRALSPGINDPYTAMVTCDRLTLSLRRIMRRGPGQGIWCDKDGTARLIVPTATFASAVDTAFNQIRQRAAGVPAVLIRLADNLVKLLSTATPDQRVPLERHLQLVLAEGRRSIAEPEDLKDLERRVEAAGAA
jgi:uncharacterized membrane protein